MPISAGRSHFLHKAQSRGSQAQAPGALNTGLRAHRAGSGSRPSLVPGQSPESSLNCSLPVGKVGVVMNTLWSVQNSGYGGIISGHLELTIGRFLHGPSSAGVQGLWCQGSAEADSGIWGCSHISHL